MVDAATALKAGIVDAIVDGDPLQVGLAYATRLLDARAVPRRISEIRPDVSELPPDFFANALRDVTARQAAYPAPRAIVACVEAAVTLPFAEGEAVEARLFEQCRVSPQSKALRHLFFARRQAGKIPGLPAGIAPRPVRTVGIVGAGTMGGGIAMNFANVGIPVVLVEATQQALDRGLGIVRKNSEASAAKGRLAPGQLAVLALGPVPGEVSAALADHVDHICQLLGNVDHVALGSDLDGGFGRDLAPIDLDTIADLQAFVGILRARGYSEEDVRKIAHGNLVRFFRKAWGSEK
jgi:hypothetical protein